MEMQPDLVVPQGKMNKYIHGTGGPVQNLPSVLTKYDKGGVKILARLVVSGKLRNGRSKSGHTLTAPVKDTVTINTSINPKQLLWAVVFIARRGV